MFESRRRAGLIKNEKMKYTILTSGKEGILGISLAWVTTFFTWIEMNVPFLTGLILVATFFKMADSWLGNLITCGREKSLSVFAAKATVKLFSKKKSVIPKN